MTNYFDIPSQRPIARDRFSIPDWFTYFTVTEDWGPHDVTEYLNTELTEVVIEKRYAHLAGRCFRIDEYCVYDWKVTVWTGTIIYRLRIDQARLRRAMRDARLLLLRITQQAVAEYVDPTSGAAGGMIDIGLSFSSLPIPQIFGDLAGLVDLGQLLASIQKIADKTERVLRELERLRQLDRQIVAQFDDVRLEQNWNRVKTFSSVEFIQVECTRWITELPEGEAIRVPDHDERIFPVRPDDQLGRGLRKAAKFDSPRDPWPEELPAEVRDAIRELRRRAPLSTTKPPLPRELPG